jgi:hypothetical protein
MVRVSCTHSSESVRDERHREVGTVLSGSVGPVHFFWRIRVRVDICRFGFGSRFEPRPAYVVW